MSRIYFHAENGCAEVSGSERAHMAILLTDRTYDLLRTSPDAARALRMTGDQWDRNRFTGMGMSGADITVAGVNFNFMDVVLNTALVHGPDSRRLAARLHGQCEIHCYVEGHNRAWLADLIDEACEDDVFRRELVNDPGTHFIQGWEQVTTLLRSASDGPVVTSYSVTEGWPDLMVVREFGEWNPTLSASPDDEDWWDECWEAFDEEPNRWRIAMDALRKADEVHALEINPDDFRSMRFGSGDSVANIWRVAEQRRVR